MSAQLAVVVSGFPRRSETFALNELLALDDAGMLAAVFATKPGEEGVDQPGVERILGRLELLPDGSAETQAAAVAERLAGTAIAGVHGYFAHRPAEVARAAAARLGLPFGFSVHARDARKVEAAALADRARSAACVIACNPDVAADLRRVGADPTLVPHGADLSRFVPTPLPPAPPLRLLAVGRLVEKKGLDDLVAAVALVERPVRVRIVGEGPERGRLAAAIAAARLDDLVELVGPLTHHELPAEYAAAHAVVVPSVEDATGDRDGLPNVVVEAMASGRAVIGTHAGAIGSGVVDGVTGLLVPPRDPVRLAAAIDGLGVDPAAWAALGAAGRERAERLFDLGACSAVLCRLLEDAYARP